MQRGFQVVALGAVALLASAALAGSAHGDGLPVPFDATQAGVTVPGGESRYATVDAGRAGTVVLRTGVDGGEVERSRVIPGTFTVPAVAYDGSASGLSADQSTLVLIRPRTRFPRSRTAFAVLEPERLAVQRRITLEGDFSFDALSPDGGTMYLIEYVDPRDPNAYQVRAYDLRRERLQPEPIVDPEVAPVTMGGAPMTRAMSPDGRWDYTLYDSMDRGRPPFIHALNTETGAAACIELEGGLVDRRRLSAMKLEPSSDGTTLAVVHRGDPVAIVDTETFEVGEPPNQGGDAAAEPDEARGVPAALVGLAALGIGVLLAAARRRRRGSRPADRDRLERLVDVDGEVDPTEVEIEERPVETEERAVGAREGARE